MPKTQTVTMAIVIPAFNEEQYLDRCLQSIAVQSIAPDQVIVVDNNSTDRTAEIAASFSFVTLIKEPIQGQAAARNAGFDAVTSDLIGRIDADTLLPPDWVERMKRFYAHDPMIAVTGTAVAYDAPAPRFFKWIQTFLYYDLNRLICGYYMLWGSNMVLPRSAWLSVRDSMSISRSIAEDMDLSVAIHSFCPIVLHRDVVVAVSGRSFRSRPRVVWQYLRRWPESLKRDSRHAEVLAWIIILIMFGLIAPPLLLARRSA